MQFSTLFITLLASVATTSAADISIDTGAIRDLAGSLESGRGQIHTIASSWKGQFDALAPGLGASKDALAQAFDQLSQAEQTLQEQAAKIAQGLGQLGTPYEETEQQQGQKLGDLSDMLGRREAKRALPLKA